LQSPDHRVCNTAAKTDGNITDVATVRIEKSSALSQLDPKFDVTAAVERHEVTKDDQSVD
jgi:hypothetical protein